MTDTLNQEWLKSEFIGTVLLSVVKQSLKLVVLPQPLLAASAAIDHMAPGTLVLLKVSSPVWQWFPKESTVFQKG